MAIDVQHLLDQQDQLAKRLIHLNRLVNSLLLDDCTRHEHTINHYLRELIETRHKAQLLNDQVQQIINQAVKDGKLERW